ncbi:MAG: OmpA family protein [Alphaproteobacteria bacterium]
MKALLNFTLVLGALALSACTQFEAKELNSMQSASAVGSPFTQALAAEYKAYSDNEHKNTHDYPDALHFARKGLSAAEGLTVLPEPIADWNIREDYLHELSMERSRIISAFDRGARETAPQLSARVQAKFDCWIEQQEETWNQGAAPTCKGEYMAAMQELEAGLPVAAAPMPAQTVQTVANEYNVDPGAPMKAENAMYLVFFDWDQSTLTSSAMSILDVVANEVKANPPAAIVIVGHADTSGPADYNDRLSMRRAEAVKAALIERGVPAGLIQASARGENELLVPTPDNVREPSNRRVNISFN